MKLTPPDGMRARRTLPAALLLALLGCDGGDAAGPAPADELVVLFEPASIDTLFAIGATVRLNPIARDGAGRPVPSPARASAAPR
jgi:hypothetical protein